MTNSPRPSAVVDFETASAADIEECGAYAYAEHPSTFVWWLGYRINGGPKQFWSPGMADPVDLLRLVEAGGRVIVHNGSFEWCIWNLCLRRRNGLAWPELEPRHLDDTMARALVSGLPAALEDIAEVLDLPHKKDMEGHRVMRQMMRPKPANRTSKFMATKAAVKAVASAERAVAKATAHPKGRGLPEADASLRVALASLAAARAMPDRLEWYDDPEKVERLRVYCGSDLDAELALDAVLPPLSPLEREIWEMDFNVNIRGVAVDREAAVRAYAVVSAEMETANRTVCALSGGVIEKITNHHALAKWLRMRGVDAPNTQAETIELLLEGEHPDDVRMVLEVRRDAGKASVAKMPALIAFAASDGRAHFLLQFAGAGRTRRWAGRGPQPQNLPRPDLKQHQIDAVLSLLGGHDPGGYISLLYGHPITVLSSCLRSLFVAAPGRVLTASDLANIEGRVAAWVAGEVWKLQAFRDFDNGTGPDLYKVAYARTFGGRPEDVSDDGDERQIGKIQELFLQYEGGAGAFATGAAAYGFDILEEGQKPRPGRKSIPAAVVEPAKIGWRKAHPAITATWRELNDLARLAVENRGQEYRTRNGKIAFICKRHYLFMKLPNGRDIPYFKPHLSHGKFGLELRYWGTDSKTKQWVSLGTYGGKLFENAVQAIARDIFAAGLLRAEASGMAVVMHVHDAAVTEHEPGRFTPDDLARILCDVGPEYDGLPVSAKGYSGPRFQK